ncbi:hemolysin family protein [Thorsellia anophelis]|uniref:Polyamine export protein n=1 Tax=Thorsellia anophelis DSM 18579 TaxID=1123402 RepID=A0A1I0DVN9_9GAMM|nr:Hemolysin, contains CBS domains [Thorsellia anophelis DSM 18579]
MLESIFIIFLLILISAFFSVSEISLAASRKTKLKMLIDSGDKRAELVIQFQERPGKFFTVVQIGLNAVAILGGIVGESAFSIYFADLFKFFLSESISETLGFLTSFILVTSFFVLFADLTPKRLGMTAPELISIRIIKPMRFCIMIFSPIVWFFDSLATLIFHIFKVPTERNDDVTSEDIYALVEAGVMAGVLKKEEHQFIENVFDLDQRTVPSAMTPRENVVYFEKSESDDMVKSKIAAHPHSKFLVCDNDIDHIIGYVDSKDLLNRVLSNQSISLDSGMTITNVLMFPDTITLSEALESFKASKEDFAVVLNEYAIVMGIITLNDVLTTLMGGLVSQGDEEQIIERGDNSWLIDGVTPIEEVQRVLGIDEFPDTDNYETIGGFMMYKLRKIPKRTDTVIFDEFKFEVVDIDNHKIDQLLVTKKLIETDNPSSEVSTNL